VSGCDCLGLYLLQLYCSCQEDQLMTGGIVGPYKLVHFYSGLLLHKGIELDQMQVVLYELQKQ